MRENKQFNCTISQCAQSALAGELSSYLIASLAQKIGLMNNHLFANAECLIKPKYPVPASESPSPALNEPVAGGDNVFRV